MGHVAVSTPTRQCIADAQTSNRQLAMHVKAGHLGTQDGEFLPSS